MPKTSYKTNEDFEQVVDALTTVAETTIASSLKTIKHIKSLDSAVIGGQFPHYITHLHCSKTGTPINTVPNEEITTLVQIYGQEAAEHILQLRADKTIASHWLRTDDKALEKLAQFDPLGYFVYAASMIGKVFAGHVDLARFNARDHKNYEAIRWQVHCEKGDLHTALRDCAIEDIITGNEIMRRFLSIFDSTRVLNDIKFTAKSMPEIGDDVQLWNNEVKLNLQGLLKKALKQGKIKKHLDISDIANLKIAFHGYANFRRQGFLRGLTESDMLINQLSQFMPDFDNNATRTPWKQRHNLIKNKTRCKPKTVTKGVRLTIASKKAMPTMMDIAAYREKKKQD